MIPIAAPAMALAKIRDSTQDEDNNYHEEDNQADCSTAATNRGPVYDASTAAPAENGPSPARLASLKHTPIGDRVPTVWTNHAASFFIRRFMVPSSTILDHSSPSW